ncbi:MAG: site-2 protease family protein [Verrucomicrobia bacterium]|nr:site-2 protease family protein [Verrucomicrobiota bacterium]
MRWSFKVARIGGIDVRIHVTFFLLLALFASFYGPQGGYSGTLKVVIFFLLVFLCVLLHEFGHAFAGKAYGIRTVDITLLPIGGVARMERMPEKPAQELVVAIAGPLVNVVIASTLLFVLAVTGNLDFGELVDPTRFNAMWALLYTNLMMVLFNLIPAFPLDGGRVLRALLATRFSYERATQIAATVGQVLALLMGVWALSKGPASLALIAIFIYMGAESESSFVQMRHATSDIPVASAMVTRFDTLNYQATLDQAVDALLGSSQHEFPVLDTNGGFAGLLTKHDLLVALRKTGSDAPVSDVMIRGLPTLVPQMSLDHAFSKIREANVSALPVVDSAGQLIGLFTTENVSELLMVQSALANKPRRFRR